MRPGSLRCGCATSRCADVGLISQVVAGRWDLPTLSAPGGRTFPLIGGAGPEADCCWMGGAQWANFTGAWRGVASTPKHDLANRTGRARGFLVEHRGGAVFRPLPALRAELKHQGACVSCACPMRGHGREWRRREGAVWLVAAGAIQAAVRDSRGGPAPVAQELTYQLRRVGSSQPQAKEGVKVLLYALVGDPACQPYASFRLPAVDVNPSAASHRCGWSGSRSSPSPIIMRLDGCSE